MRLRHSEWRGSRCRAWARETFLRRCYTHAKANVLPTTSGSNRRVGRKRCLLSRGFSGGRHPRCFGWLSECPSSGGCSPIGLESEGFLKGDGESSHRYSGNHLITKTKEER